MVWLFIFFRIVANPFSNVFQKVLTRKAAGPLFIICATHGMLSVAGAAVVLFEPGSLSNEFWFNIAVVALLTVTGNVLIVQALKRSDLSILGPINAYKPVVSLVPGMILLHEFPGAMGIAGILLIVTGSYFTVDKNLQEPHLNVFIRFFKDRGIQYRFAALILTAIEAAFLKRALLASSPILTFAFWALLGFGVSLMAVMLLPGGNLKSECGILQTNKKTYFMLGLSTGLMQLCTIFTLKELQVGYALALFQTSTLLSVFLGYKVFQERNIMERLFGSVMMIAGAILIILGR